MAEASGPIGDDRSGAPAWLLDVGLFLTAPLLVAGILIGVLGGGIASAPLAPAMAVHVPLTLYDGRFGRLRRWTWVLLVLAGFARVAATFLGYVLPWGQMSFWAATTVTRIAAAIPIVGERIVAWLWSGAPLPIPWSTLGALVPAAVAALAILDVWLFHARRFAGWRRTTLLLFAVVLVAGTAFIVRSSGISTPPAPAEIGGLPTPAAIMPSLTDAPFFAMLRAAPDKRLGVAAVALVLLLPALWPWRGVGRLHGRPTRIAWSLATLLFAASAATLAWLGLQMPEPDVILESQVFAAYVLAYLLAIPFLLGLWARGTPVSQP